VPQMSPPTAGQPTSLPPSRVVLSAQGTPYLRGN
jgi:hypothetical protein